jgi:hypothetical protein
MLLFVHNITSSNVLPSLLANLIPLESFPADKLKIVTGASAERGESDRKNGIGIIKLETFDSYVWGDLPAVVLYFK